MKGAHDRVNLMPYITYSSNRQNAGRLFRESKALAKKLGVEDSAVRRRGGKTIRDIVREATGLGFDTAIILKLERSGSGLKVRTDAIRITDIQGNYSWRRGYKPEARSKNG